MRHKNALVLQYYSEHEYNDEHEKEFKTMITRKNTEKLMYELKKSIYLMDKKNSAMT